MYNWSFPIGKTEFSNRKKVHKKIEENIFRQFWTKLVISFCCKPFINWFYEKTCSATLPKQEIDNLCILTNFWISNALVWRLTFFIPSDLCKFEFLHILKFKFAIILYWLWLFCFGVCFTEVWVHYVVWRLVSRNISCVFVGDIVTHYGKTSDAFIICEFRNVFTIVKM